MIEVDRSWTLFLDRDGVINQHLPGEYICTQDQFELLPGVVATIAVLSDLFGRIIVVTNQQGIGKGLMSEQQLAIIHQRMETAIIAAGGRLEGIYYSPELQEDPVSRRKPKPDLALEAQADFPAIDFTRSIMVGDSVSDMQFGYRLGMTTVLVSGKPGWAEEWERARLDDPKLQIDYRISDLRALLGIISCKNLNQT